MFFHIEVLNTNAPKYYPILKKGYLVLALELMQFLIIKDIS